MAGQASRGPRSHGRSPRPGSTLPATTTVSEAEPEAGPTTAAGRPSKAPGRSATQAPATRAVYRQLQTKGLTPAEAANLTAFICGLPTTDLHWSLKQINQLLFLRRLRQTGRFDGNDGGTTRAH